MILPSNCSHIKEPGAEGTTPGLGAALAALVQQHRCCDR
jgi:hypothetical protein